VIGRRGFFFFGFSLACFCRRFSCLLLFSSLPRFPFPSSVSAAGELPVRGTLLVEPFNDNTNSSKKKKLVKKQDKEKAMNEPKHGIVWSSVKKGDKRP